MKRPKSKSSFLRELNVLLAFRFEEGERHSIIEDYEDFFTAEGSCGKSEVEICASMEPPKKIVENLCREMNKNEWMLFKNTSVKAGMVFTAFLLLEIISLSLCREYHFNYFYAALLNRILYLGCGIWMLGDQRPGKLRYKEHAKVFGVTAVVFLLDSLAISLTSVNHGILYESMLWLVIAGSCLYGLYFIGKLQSDTKFDFNIILHLSGLVSVCIYLINELSLRYNGKPDILKGRIECIIIYLVTILFCIIFRKMKSKRIVTWMLN